MVVVEYLFERGRGIQLVFHLYMLQIEDDVTLKEVLDRNWRYLRFYQCSIVRETSSLSCVARWVQYRSITLVSVLAIEVLVPILS